MLLVWFFSSKFCFIRNSRRSWKILQQIWLFRIDLVLWIRSFSISYINTPRSFNCMLMIPSFTLTLDCAFCDSMRIGYSVEWVLWDFFFLTDKEIKNWREKNVDFIPRCALSSHIGTLRDPSDCVHVTFSTGYNSA